MGCNSDGISQAWNAFSCDNSAALGSLCDRLLKTYYLPLVLRRVISKSGRGGGEDQGNWKSTVGRKRESSMF